MKFGAFKEFRNLPGDDANRYLQVDLTKSLRELANGLNKLSFLDNFECFITTVTIAATSELQIRNELRSGEVPRYRLILRGGSNSQHVVDGDATWTADYVYLKNTAASAATLTVAFLR